METYTGAISDGNTFTVAELIALLSGVADQDTPVTLLLPDHTRLTLTSATIPGKTDEPFVTIKTGEEFSSWLLT